MWNIEYFTWEKGGCPFQEFLDSLDPKTELVYVEEMIDRLAELGNKLPYPHSNHLRDGIFELRVLTLHSKVRCFYFFLKGQNIIITHGCPKKKPRVNDEIAQALKYQSVYMRGVRK